MGKTTTADYFRTARDRVPQRQTARLQRHRKTVAYGREHVLVSNINRARRQRGVKGTGPRNGEHIGAAIDLNTAYGGLRRLADNKRRCSRSSKNDRAAAADDRTACIAARGHKQTTIRPDRGIACHAAAQDLHQAALTHICIHRRATARHHDDAAIRSFGTGN